MTMFLAFGLAFEVPVALVVLVKMGVVTVEKLKEWRSYFIVGAFVVAAVVTPPDVVSQLALAIPMCLLYELGILAARLVSKPAEPKENAAVDPEKSAKMDTEMDAQMDAEADSASFPASNQAGFLTGPGRFPVSQLARPSSNHHSVPAGIVVQARCRSAAAWR
jgi:hypothetical protein